MKVNNGKICATCGTQYPPGYLQNSCLICEDDRQYVPDEGQQWTNRATLSGNHHSVVREIKPRLYEINLQPKFGIGQRALLVQSAGGNILWDCIPLIDEPLIAFIQQAGGIRAMAISHPHYYSNQAEWSAQFDCPVYLPETEKDFVVYPGDHIRFWKGSGHDFWDGIRVIRIGGHFLGSSVLRVPGISKQGTLLCGDTFNLSPSRKHFSVMYSYPNKIPLPVREVQRIRTLMASLDFDEVYGFWSYQNLTDSAKSVMLQSLDRYV